MIYDRAGKLHVMIQHVDQGFVQRCVIQKYCGETRNRQQYRSITLQLHIVHSGIQPEATACTLTTSQPNHLTTRCNVHPKYALQSQNNKGKSFKDASDARRRGEFFSAPVIFQYHSLIHRKGTTRETRK